MAKRIDATYGAGSNWSKAGTTAKVTPESTGDSGTAATIGADAIAVGENTVAIGDVSLSMVDRGRVTSVRGEAEATASASGGSTFTAADTYASVEGADFVFIRTVNSPGSSSTTSTTKVIAFTFENFDFPDGPVEHIFVHDRPSRDRPELSPQSGNLAIISAQATATGDATVTLTQTDSLTTDDLSLIAGDAHIFIG